MTPLTRRPAHPGVVLRDDFLTPMWLTQTQLANRMGVSLRRVNEIVNGTRGIPAETAVLLSDALGTTPEFWMSLQTAYDLYQASVTSDADFERALQALSLNAYIDLILNVRTHDPKVARLPAESVEYDRVTYRLPVKHDSDDILNADDDNTDQ